MAKAKAPAKAKSRGDDDDDKPDRNPYDPDLDIVVAEAELTPKFIARVMRYDGGVDDDGELVTGTPKLVVYKVGKKGTPYMQKRIPGEVAVALAKAITKFQKDGAFA